MHLLNGDGSPRNSASSPHQRMSMASTTASVASPGEVRQHSMGALSALNAILQVAGHVPMQRALAGA